MDGLQHWFDIVTAAIGSIIAAVAGVAMRYTHQMQRGEVVNWSRVWLDGPTIFVMGIAGYAAHEYFSLPESVSYVAASLLGYLGPRAVSMAIEYVEKRGKKDE